MVDPLFVQLVQSPFVIPVGFGNESVVASVPLKLRVLSTVSVFVSVIVIVAPVAG
jgi:hypothetical protein